MGIAIARANPSRGPQGFADNEWIPEQSWPASNKDKLIIQSNWEVSPFAHEPSELKCIDEGSQSIQSIWKPVVSTYVIGISISFALSSPFTYQNMSLTFICYQSRSRLQFRSGSSLLFGGMAATCSFPLFFDWLGLLVFADLSMSRFLRYPGANQRNRDEGRNV